MGGSDDNNNSEGSCGGNSNGGGGGRANGIGTLTDARRDQREHTSPTLVGESDSDDSDDNGGSCGGNGIYPPRKACSVVAHDLMAWPKAAASII